MNIKINLLKLYLSSIFLLLFQIKIKEEFKFMSWKRRMQNVRFTFCFSICKRQFSRNENNMGVKLQLQRKLTWATLRHAYEIHIKLISMEY